jgi:hypothetical protein
VRARCSPLTLCAPAAVSPRCLYVSLPVSPCVCANSFPPGRAPARPAGSVSPSARCPWSFCQSPAPPCCEAPPLPPEAPPFICHRRESRLHALGSRDQCGLWGHSCEQNRSGWRGPVGCSRRGARPWECVSGSRSLPLQAVGIGAAWCKERQLYQRRQLSRCSNHSRYSRIMNPGTLACPPENSTRGPRVPGCPEWRVSRVWGLLNLPSLGLSFREDCWK